MNLTSLIPAPYRWLALALLAAALVAFGWLRGAQHQEQADAVQLAQVHSAWDKERAELGAQALAKAQANAAETARRIAAMQENQHAQDQLLARMRRDRDDALAAADRVRQQSAEAARAWSARLADSPSAADLAAAGAAIQLLTDVRSRLEHAGAELAGYADAAHAAGLQCERDFDALTAGKR